MALRSRWLIATLAGLLAGCTAAAPAPPARPCFTVQTNPGLRAENAESAEKIIADLAHHIRLSPEDEALRSPKSLEDVRKILRRDAVYLFGEAATYAHAQDSVEGRFAEASLELLIGESQLVAAQILGVQEAWVGGDLRIARASLAGEGAAPTTERGRMLAQLVRVVEEGNKIGTALGMVAPAHLVRGAEIVRKLRTEAPTDTRTFGLTAEYHRLRGEWREFEAAMKAAEAQNQKSPALCYLRGMEQLERLRRPDLGVGAMRDCLVRFPKFVRAQAALVLMATNPTDSLAELEKLKIANQDHYLVMLLEPTLAADKELWRMQNTNVAR